MKIFLLFLGLLTLSSCAPENKKDEMVGEKKPKEENPVPNFSPDDPSQGALEQALGFYSKGSLKNATNLPMDGAGYTKIFRPRQRWFATEDMVYFISTISKELKTDFPNQRDLIQIGDMSAARGGYINLHSSHQNGLDVDIAFLRRNETMQDVNDTSGFRESFVAGGKLTNNFDLDRNWALAKHMVAQGRAQRIFVNEVVKKAFCQLAKKRGELNSQKETLRRLRPYAGHEDHFHVRITCPQNSPKCEAQVEVPEGSGC